MREAWIVARRELKGYFVSPIAYVVGILFLLFQVTITSILALNQEQPARMDVFFSLLPITLGIFMPALSMRLWSEERKLGTLELLLTFPVRISQLIAGKFVAALLFVAVLLVLTLGVPLTMSHYGALDWGPVGGGYLASLLLASSYLAVGMFFSSITREQIVALVLAIMFLVLLYLLGSPLMVVLLSAVGLPNGLTNVLAAISPQAYFQSITRGVMDVGDLTYYAAFAWFFLSANGLILVGKRRLG